MKKRKYKYMHTMDGVPATFDGNQVVYASRTCPVRLAPTREKIYRQRRKTGAWRRKQELPEDRCCFDYLRVIV